jgi:hypothetical protein
MKEFFQRHERPLTSFAVSIGLLVVGGIGGYNIERHMRPTIDVTAPEVQNVIIKCAKGKGSFVINVSDGWVKLNQCPVDDAAKGFWQAVNAMAGKTCVAPQ